MLTSDEEFTAEIVGEVKGLEPDIALIKLTDEELKKYQDLSGSEPFCLELEMSLEVERGYEVKAIGYPLGMVEPNITGGEITNFISGNRLSCEKYVTNAAINPGNSGGPSITSSGKVIGINTSVAQGADNVGFITPISFANILLKNLNSVDEPALADLGGDIQKNSKAMSDYFGQKNSDGVIITRIEKDGTLDQAGIKVSDVILSINNIEFDRHGIVKQIKVLRHQNLFDITKLIPIGDDFPIQYWRDGKECQVNAKAHRTPSYGIKSEPILSNVRYIKCFGMVVQELSYEIISALENTDQDLQLDFMKRLDSKLPWIVVTYFEQDREGIQMEWSLGEIITSIDDKKVHSLEDLLKVTNQLKKEKKKKVLLKCASGKLGYYTLENEVFEILQRTNDTF